MNVIYSFTNNPGIGDNVRGLISLFQIKNKINHIKNFNIHVNFSYSSIGNYLSHKLQHEIFEGIKTKDIKYFMYADENYHDDEIIQYILNTHDDFLNINTNNFPNINDINDDIKEYIKNLFQFTSEFSDIFNSYFAKLGGDFDIFHYRFDDDIFYNDYIQTDKYKMIIETQQQANTRLLLVLSNSLKLKQELYEIHNNNKVIVFLHKPIHTRDTTTEESMHIFIDFFLITKAKHIYCWSSYSFTSNFVLWNSYIYNIPLTKIIL